MPDPTHYLWCDLETTGEPDERKGPILEAAFILTNTALEQVAEERSWVLNPYDWCETHQPNEGQHLWRRQIDEHPVVREMHTANGLLRDLEELNLWANHPIAEAHVLDMLEDNDVKPHHVMLAGSGVGHFDRRFIRAQMPRLEKHLYYPNLDIGVMRRFAKHTVGFSIPSFNDDKTHRALDDVRLHLEEARWWKETMGSWIRVFQNEVGALY
jgi:oligoribonuclease (3'-5' exoribonuclease)